MSQRAVFDYCTRLIVAIACISTAYLYWYPIWFGCAFPSTTGSVQDGFQNTLSRHLRPTAKQAHVAPFRFLVLADPQLEGDSSLPDPEDALFARLKAHWARIEDSNRTSLRHELQDIAQQLLTADIPNALWTARKSLDLFGNDYYLAHIYRTLHWWTKPTHVTVLGDLIGSQWVSDDEFDWRGWRYWNRVFAGSQKVDEELMSLHENDQNNHIPPDDARDWSTQILNIAGNHDIGYAGDISKDRVARFERLFGRANWDIKFPYPSLPNVGTGFADGDTPSLHVIVLNDMVLDGPHLDSTLQSQTYDYLNALITQPRLSPVMSNNSFTLLLTHVPLHKKEGTCIDAPFFSFWPSAEDDENGPGGNGAYAPNGLKEQNHLSEGASKQILESVFGMNGNLGSPGHGKGRHGLILTGHDHEGCDVVHYIKHNKDYIEPQDDHSTAENSTVSDPDQSAEENRSDSDSDSRPDADTESDPAPPKKISLGDIEAALAESQSQPQPATEPWSWNANHTSAFTGRLPNTPKHPPKDTAEDIHTSLREITLRSMMGSYGGNAGLLSLWYDFTAHEWQYEMSLCPLGVQHIWWAVHVVDMVAAGLLLLQFMLRLFTSASASISAPAPAQTVPSKSSAKRSVSTDNTTRNAKHQKKHTPKTKHGPRNR